MVNVIPRIQTDVGNLLKVLNIDLVHGWIDQSLKIDYNSAMDLLMSSPKTEQEENLKLQIKQFMDSYPSQLTYQGLELIMTQAPSLCILFRNNHFSVLHRHQQRLFTLITDISFVNQSVNTIDNFRKSGNALNVSMK